MAQTKSGTFALQGILDSLSQANLERILEIIRPEVSLIALNEYGTHFLQKFIQVYQKSTLGMKLLEHTSTLGIDKHGVVVIKTLIKKRSAKKELRYEILGSLQNCFEELAFSEYGHYLIEELFLYFNCYELQNLLSYLVSNTSRLSLNQYSSSILRKAI